jgi:hypothetical protein
MGMSLDWRSRKTLVIESDDWGVCSWAPDRATFETVRQMEVTRDYFERLKSWIAGSLETPGEMERLFVFLERYRGRDGRLANLVANYGVANPDYDRIEQSGMQQYYDLFLDEGFPRGWERGDIISKAREGISRGVWVAEYHTRLHHAQPYKWLEAVRQGSPQASALFAHSMFQCEERRREYEDMTPSQQVAWAVPAIRRMAKLFGRPARCGINSDAYLETEKIWAAEGIQVRLDRNSTPNAGSAEPLTEPLMGSVQPDSGLTYLRRNCYLEPLGSGDLEDPRGAKAAYDAILHIWEAGEPAVCSSHRKNYVSLIAEETDNGYDQAEWLLGKLTDEHPDMYFLSSWEVAQMCRQGASAELFGDHVVVRNWTDREMRVTQCLPENSRPGDYRVLIGDHVPGLEYDDGNMTVFCAPGDYLIELETTCSMAKKPG